MKNDPKKIQRYTPSERANHWLTAIFFFLAALSGLSFFEPLYYPLTLWFGGGVLTRILHPFFGLALLISFGVMYSKYWQLNIMTPADREWLRHVRELVNSDDRNMPEVGKFNGGQKILFWLMAICTALLLLSGIVIWRAYFSFLFPVWLVRLSSVVHAASAAVMIGAIIFHIYAAIWTSESLSAMVNGWVRRPWAKQHHPAWFREMTEKDK
jgi:formate dehydrogenase subunit gamma